MSNAVKIDQRAFARGVDEVLLLKPVRRAVGVMVFGQDKRNPSSSNQRSNNSEKTYVVIPNRKHDEPAT